MSAKKIDYDVAVVGQGIAGTLMAWFLHKQGKNVLIIDDNFNGSASKVAAGIVNPITGKNFVYSWKINDFMPFAIQTYDELSHFLGIRTYTKTNIVRALYSVEDENNWLSKASDPHSSKYIKASADISEFIDKVEMQFAYGELDGTFSVHMFEILKHFRDKWLYKHAYINEKFDYASISQIDNGFNYNKYSFGAVVFCEGYKATLNPFFPKIGLAPSKGEVLILRINGAPFKKMYKDGVFLVHLEDDLYWLGSGYEWDTLNENPTKLKYELLVSAAERIIKIPFEIIDHVAAIRPTMFSRRPVMMLHDNIPGMYLFNGLGTKGASIGPFAAHQFSRFIDKGNPADLILI